MKNLPSEMIRAGGPNGQLLVMEALPMLYINRYKTNNLRLKTFTQRVWRYLKDAHTEALDEDAPDKQFLERGKIELQNSP
jgi:hypothetical protein